MCSQRAVISPGQTLCHYIPAEVRKPIQSRFIAEEVTQTRVQEQETAKAEALLKEAEKSVELEKERVVVDTERQSGEACRRRSRGWQDRC